MRGIGVCAGLLFLCFSAGSRNSPEELFKAIRNNDLTYLKGQLAAGADVNSRDARGTTLLMHAAAFGSAEAVKVLLDAGADVNAKNGLDATALIWGAGDPRIAAMLVAKGADVNAVSKQGRTPLMIAASCDGCSETVRLLLSKGADPNKRDGHGFTALRLAADSNDFESVRLLIAAGAPPDAADGDGTTPLQSGASNCNLPMTKYLLAKGADPNTANTFSGKVKFGNIQLIHMTPLMWAAPACSADMIRTLLDAGANVNETDIRGMTALMLAIASERRDPATVRLLLDAGADPNIKSKIGETALDWARKFRDADTLAALNGARAKAGDLFTPPQRPKTAPKDSREAVAAATGLLERVSTEFFNQSGCVGCHHQPMTSMAARAARDAGVHVDEAAAKMRVQMMAGQWTALQPTVMERVDIGGRADNETYSLLAMGAEGYPAGPVTDGMTSYVASLQQRDGSWQLPGTSRPPFEDGAIARTAFAVRVLQLYGWPARKSEFDERIARARDFLSEATPVTNGDAAMKLAGLAWAGVDRSRLRGPAKALLDAQNADGGWSGNRNLPSDAFATGQALWSLRESGVLKPADAAYQRGVKYLLSTQWSDGSWYVRSRSPKFQPYFQSGFPYDHDQWISSAGTAWAVMALAPAVTNERASR